MFGPCLVGGGRHRRSPSLARCPARINHRRGIAVSLAHHGPHPLEPSTSSSSSSRHPLSGHDQSVLGKFICFHQMINDFCFNFFTIRISSIRRWWLAAFGVGFFFFWGRVLFLIIMVMRVGGGGQQPCRDGRDYVCIRDGRMDAVIRL